MRNLCLQSARPRQRPQQASATSPEYYRGRETTDEIVTALEGIEAKRREKATSCEKTEQPNATLTKESPQNDERGRKRSHESEDKDDRKRKRFQ